MKKGWEIKKLGEILKLEYGKPLEQKLRNPKGDYPVYGANGEIAKSNEFFYNKKSIIVGRKGSAGEINLTEDKFWPLDVTYFVTFDELKSNLYFLFYLLKKLNLPKLAKGVKPGINRNDVYGIKIPIPPLSEQQRIVEILDSAFEKIDKAKANLEKNLQNAKDLFQSKLNEIFSQKGKDWQEKKLGEVCTIKGRIGYRGYTKQDLVDKGQGAISLSPSNIQNNKFNTDKCTYISWFKYEESPEIMVFEGDILFVKTGSTYGKVALVEVLPEKATINPQFVVLKNLKCSNKFLYYGITSSSFKEQLEGIIGGSATPTLSQTNLAELEIPIPPLSEQQRIVKILDNLSSETEKLVQIYQQKISDIDELKKSIFEKAFNGDDI